MQNIKPIKIAVILPSLLNKAPIQVAKDIVDQLILQGCYVDIYYFKDIVELDFSNQAKQISFFHKIDFNKYDIIHSHTFVPDLYIWFNKRRIKTKTVSTLHNEIDKILLDIKGRLLSKLYSKLWVNSLKSFSKVVCLSIYAESQMKNKFNIKNTIKIYNGRSVNVDKVNNDDFEIFSRLKTEFVVLGIVANISKIKGIEQVIDCLTLLEGYALVVIGDGKERINLEERVNRLKLANRCFFLGHRTNAHLYMSLFDIYIMSSRSEGFPLVLIEAAQYSKPIVCSDLPIFKEFFDKEEIEFFHLDNIESLKSSIIRAFDNKKKLSININLKYFRSYTVKIMGKNYLELFNAIIYK
jgi:glycosyltransferase involved in cell wall biosynthesis